MSRAVSLGELVAALQFSDATAVAFFDRSTSQIVTPSQDPVEAGGPNDPEPEKRPESFELLPAFTEQHEIELARQFAATVENAEDRQRLHLALASASPREAFENALFRCRIANEWFQFRDQRLLQLARAWLETHGIPYVDDVTRHAD
jgi:hypothetical protein